MFYHYVPAWKTAPCLRLLCALIAGILVQRYLEVQYNIILCVLMTGLVGVTTLLMIPTYQRYRLGVLNGVLITASFAALGAFVTRQRDIYSDPAWYGKYYCPGDAIRITLLENPVKKTQSWKALAQVASVMQNSNVVYTHGDIVVYFKIDSMSLPAVGGQIISRQPIQEIQSSGNPGSFDYRQYCFFQQITGQVFLRKGEFVLIQGKHAGILSRSIQFIQGKVLKVLRRNIKGSKEYGLAEALLIGYKYDLDDGLVQSYTNSGVVHIIAISGMHIALIYWLLAAVCKPLEKIKHAAWLSGLFIVAGLWFFSLLAGAQASVVRSAAMFTCIVVARFTTRRTKIYNTLSVSALSLLCYDPFWLWDVGFQLSYAAVLGIVIFSKPFSALLSVKNKLLDHLWQLNAVCFAAQLFTTPLSIYHFHQFPCYFFLTNCVAVPLSSIVVFGEILLCVIAWCPPLASLIGDILSGLIRLMNGYIEHIEQLPPGLWNGLEINIAQAAVLTIAAAASGYWWLKKQKHAAWAAMVSILMFSLLRSISFYSADHQCQVVVYNINHHIAIELIRGRHYILYGDSGMNHILVAPNNEINIAHSFYRIHGPPHLPTLSREGNCIEFESKRILIVGNHDRYSDNGIKCRIDLLIVVSNSAVALSSILSNFSVKQVVFTLPGSARVVDRWEKECDSAHVKHYNVREQGAFVMNAN